MKFKPESEIRDFLLPTADNLGIEIVEVETKISKIRRLPFISTPITEWIWTLAKIP